MTQNGRHICMHIGPLPGYLRLKYGEYPRVVVQLTADLESHLWISHIISFNRLYHMLTESLWNLAHHCHRAIAMFVCIFLDQKFKMQDIPSVSGIPTENISTPLCSRIQWVTKHKLLLKRHIIHLWKCVVPPGPPGEIMQAKDTISMSNLWGPQCIHSRQDMALLGTGSLASNVTGDTIDAPYYSDVLMNAMASQGTGVSIVCLTVCSGVDQRKHQSSALLALCEGNSPVTGGFPHKGPTNAENVSICWRHHVLCQTVSIPYSVCRTLIFV